MGLTDSVKIKLRPEIVGYEDPDIAILVERPETDEEFQHRQAGEYQSYLDRAAQAKTLAENRRLAKQKATEEQERAILRRLKEKYPDE